MYNQYYSGMPNSGCCCNTCNPNCQMGYFTPCNPCCKGGRQNSYALILVLFILLVIIGAARW